MKIIIHRGAQEPGGNCIELAAGKGRLLLDYGAPRPFDPAKPERAGAAEEAILDLPGLYGKANPPILALLISSTQLDHYGALLARGINPGVKIYMTELMEELARLPGKMSGKGRQLPAGIQHYVRNRKFNVGPFAITPYLMDGNAAEAYAFLVEAEGKRVLYTGDFREHGNKIFKQFLAANTGKLDALIVEGAQADLEKGPDEQEVLDHVELQVKGRRGALYFACSGQDIALLARLAELARRTKRFLVVDGYLALVLERMKAQALAQGVELRLPGLETEYLRVIRNAATQRIYTLSEYKEVFARMRPRMFGWDWVRANLPKLIIPVRANSQLWAEEQIQDFSRGSLFYSGWEAYSEEPGMGEALAWFKARGLAETEIPATGHAYFSTIKKLVENKKPRFIIPVNTTHAEKFALAFGKRARLLANGEEFALE
jgi:ribonuclease J